MTQAASSLFCKGHTVRILLSFLLLLAAQLPAAEKTNKPKNINSSGCQCLIEAPLKVCADKTFKMTVHLLSDKELKAKFPIKLLGTADAHFGSATGPKVVDQEPCPSTVVYTVYPGALGAKKIEVWVGSTLCHEIEVVKLDIVSLEFTSDYQIMTDKKDDHLRGGKVYKAPEWTKEGVNNPIVHGKDKKIGCQLILQYDALTNDTYNGEGSSATKAWLHFGPRTGTLRPGRNTLIYKESEGPLPNLILNDAGGAISWTVAITPCTYNFETGPHKIYVVAAAPYASKVTEWRVNRVTSICNGTADADASLLKLTKAMTFNLVEGFVGDEEDPSWSLVNGKSGDCISQVFFWNRGLAMLGWPQGEIRYCFPTLQKGAKVSPRFDAWAVGPRGQLGFFATDVDPRDKDAGNHFNRFEATLFYNAQYWLGGMKGAHYKTPEKVMKAVCARSIWGLQANQKWFYSLAEDW